MYNTPWLNEEVQKTWCENYETLDYNLGNLFIR